jgi:uncharacterized protein (TIGR02145 family)
MKICTRCTKAYPEGRFCLECGGELKEQSSTQKETGSGISMGDKNVVAGDIIGRKDEYRITGSATIIKNEDETRKIIHCNVCGKTELITESVRCPTCLINVCKDHYNLKARRCTNCDNNAENDYRNILEQVLADGKIDLDERIILDARAKVFKITPERAQKIENEFKNQIKRSGKQSLNAFDIIEFNKIKKEIATLKDLIPSFERIGRLYAKYPDNEDIKRRYYQLGPYALGLTFKEKLSKNFDDFYAEFAKIEIEILQNKDLRAAIDILDYVKNHYTERELDTQAKELDILYRFYETEGDDYIQVIEDLLKCILVKNWNESDYASFILYKIFTDKKIVFQDENLNGWEVNLTSININDNILIQLYLLYTKAVEQKMNLEEKGNEFLFQIFTKCKTDGYFSKFETFDAFKAYFNDDIKYKKLWEFLTSKGYKVLPFDQFIEKISETSGMPDSDKKMDNGKENQEIASKTYENEYLYMIFNKCKTDGYFSKYESYNSFKDYFHDDASYKKLWDFLNLKEYKVLPFGDFIKKIFESQPGSAKEALVNNNKTTEKSPDAAKKKGLNSSLEITDLGGVNKYKTVKLGNQVWMAEDLNVDTYRNGDHILYADTKEKWEDFYYNRKGCWCYQNFDETNSLFGRHYNYYAVLDPRGLAPEGFRLSHIDDWNILIDYLGGRNALKTVINKLKNSDGFALNYKLNGNTASFWNCSSNKDYLCFSDYELFTGEEFGYGNQGFVRCLESKKK